jgi:ABC-type phosphate transport system substrate-binding protein
MGPIPGDRHMKNHILLGASAFIALLSILIGPARGDAQKPLVRLHGANSEARTILPRKNDIEAKNNVQLEIIADSSMEGLMALVQGNADLAMVAGTLQLNAANLNAEKPGSIDLAKLHEFDIFYDILHPVCNFDNSLDSLTMDQVKQILTGKIKNWKDLGGFDEPIVVIMPSANTGGYQTVKAKILGDENFASDAQIVAMPLVSKLVHTSRGGFSMLSSANKTTQVKVLKCDKHVGVVNSLVCVGDPSEQLKAVIKTIQEMFQR